MNYLKLQNFFPVHFLAFLISSCGVQESTPQAATVTESTPSLEPTKPEDQDPTPQAQTVTEPVPSLEPTTSIEKVAENGINKSKEFPLAETNYAIYTDARSNISIMYPEDWKQVSHENDVEFQGSTGDIVFEVLYAPFHELDQVAKQYFTESHYQEASRTTLNDPLGYLSVGNLRDGAHNARMVIGNEEIGLIRLEATTGPDDDFEQHLQQFQIVIDSLNLQNVLSLDNSNHNTEHAKNNSTRPPEEDAESTPLDTISEDIGNTTYTDPKTGLSFSYPASWSKVQHEHDTEFEGPIGAVTIASLGIPIQELDQFAQDFLSGSDEYTEETRDALKELPGYISIGNLQDGARQVRAIVGNEQTGLVILEATTGPEYFEQHLRQFQNILSSIVLPEVGAIASLRPHQSQEQEQDYNPTPIINYGPSTIRILNISEIDTDLMQEWASFSEAKMADRRADILMVLWPVGKFVREGGFSHPFETMEVLITHDEIDYLMNEIEIWLDAQYCIQDDPVRLTEELEMYRDWLTRGADASTQLTICPASRLIMMGLTPNHRDPNDPMYPIDLQDFFIHELYHAMQQDLMDQPCNDIRDRLGREETNTPWLVEGAADYFAKHVVAELTGRFDPINRILRNALNASQEEGFNIYQGGIDKTGAAALQILIELETLDSASILDGSMFHSCARELELTNDNPYVLKAKDSWHMIENIDGKYVFRDQVLQ